MAKPIIIILMGPPGCGKGTQAQRLNAKYGWPQVATGDLIREQISQQSELGKKLEAYVTQGKFPPDKLILDILAKRITQPDCKKGFILDGVPRTKGQAKTLDKYLKMFGIEPFVLNIAVPDEEIADRILERLICSKCSASYHPKYAPPKQEGICDVCGSELIQRTDDTKQVLDYRLSIYHEKTEPLLKYYRKSDRLTIVDGTQPQEKVAEAIETAIQS